MKTSNWTEFRIYPEQDNQLKAKYRMNNNELEVKLLFHANRGFYYSFLNDAFEEARNLLEIKNYVNI